MRAPATVVAALSLAVGMVVLPSASAQDQGRTEPGEVPIEAGVDPDTGVPDERPGEAFAEPEIAELQRTATEVQEELDTLTAHIDDARDELDEATEQLDEARAEREAAEKELAAKQDEVDEFSRSVFTAMGRPNEMRALLGAGSTEDILAGSSMISVLRAEQDSRLLGALDRHREAVETQREAAEMEETAAQRMEELERRTSDASNRADAVSSELRGPIGDANEAVTAQQEAQLQRNERTEHNWQSYLDRLDEAGVTPPRAAQLRDPSSFPAGLRTLEGKDGQPQAGVAHTTAEGEQLLVLPEETIDAVTDAVAELGRPYMPRGSGDEPVAYSCDGLVHSVFHDNGLEMPQQAAAQMAEGTPVAYADAQPGDVVLVGPAEYGVQHVGIVLDDNTMLAADGRIASVAVTDLPSRDTALEVIRPALGQQEARDVPERADGELHWRCGGVEVPMSADNGLSATDGATDGSDADESRDPSGATTGVEAPNHAEAIGAWGGYPNGLIPSSALCGIGVGNHALRCDAAQSFVALSRAYAAQFGEQVCVTDSYRTFDAQVDLYHRKPALAAVPGTSNHGWGIALDMCGGIQSFDTAQFRWMTDNAAAFGWVHPNWARQGGGREEPWHWEFVGRA